MTVTTPLKDLLTIGGLDRDTLIELIDVADTMNAHPSLHDRCLAGCTVASIFDKPSTRTRVSIAGAVARLGGQTQVLRPDELQLGRGETVEDTARVLGSFVSAVTIRTFEHERVEQFAAACDVPVINALTDTHHPLQALADVMTLRQCFGSWDGLRVAWIGDGNNVAHSLMEACALLGIDITLATPPDRQPDATIVAGARVIAQRSGSAIDLVSDPHEAARDVSAVATDVWSSMGEQSDVDDLRAKLRPYRVDDTIMSLAPDAIFLHCLPAHRGDEVTADVIDGPQSRVFQQAANRLPTVQALLWRLVNDHATSSR
ncbi:MAG: ornithine carbamoyltransferase [Thermoleophilia bacterium]|nr:ornithine carbamoyltransferase [Thermoleophilia bacterium]